MDNMARKERPRGYKVRRMTGEILTARPDGMKYEVCREKRKEQQERLKARLKQGFMVWKSKCVGVEKGGESWGTLVGRVPAVVFED